MCVCVDVHVYVYARVRVFGWIYLLLCLYLFGAVVPFPGEPLQSWNCEGVVGIQQMQRYILHFCHSADA